MRHALVLALLVAGAVSSAVAQTPPAAPPPPAPPPAAPQRPAQPPPAAAPPAPQRPGLNVPARSDSVNLRALPEGPGKRVVELQGLDKVTARTQKLVAPVGEMTRFGTLDINVGDCMVNTPEAAPESVAYLTIVDHKPGQKEEKLFAGWMFASAPSLSALDHGVYDVRVLACTRSQASSAPSSR